MVHRGDAISVVAPEIIATSTLIVETRGTGFTDLTVEAGRFLTEVGAREGTLLVFLRHTSASLTIQENADPDVQTDLTSALGTLAPFGAAWEHNTEGPDDMPAHVKAMLTGVSLQIPVMNSTLMLGTWQAIYLIEHRTRPHRREVILQFSGRREPD